MENLLQGVENTLFIPLYARIYASKNFKSYYFDEMAITLEDKFDFSSIKNKSNQYQLMANVARAYIFNDTICKFIKNNPKCNLVYLGIGLDTSISKYKDIKDITCYGIDFSDVISLREKIFNKENLTTSNIFDTSWFDKIKDKDIPTLFLVSGVFQYCEIKDVKNLIKKLKDNFKLGEILFDATDKYGIKYANKYVKKTGNNAMLKFYIETGDKFAKDTNTSLLSWRCFFTEARKILKTKLKFMTKLYMKVVDKKKRATVLHLRLN